MINRSTLLDVRGDRLEMADKRPRALNRPEPLTVEEPQAKKQRKPIRVWADGW